MQQIQNTLLKYYEERPDSRQQRIFSPQQLSAKDQAKPFLMNPKVPAGAQFSAQLFVERPGGTYEPASVFYVPPDSELLKRSPRVLNQPFESGWYVESAPGCRFAFVGEEHTGGGDAYVFRANLEGDEENDCGMILTPKSRTVRVGVDRSQSLGQVFPFRFQAVVEDEPRRKADREAGKPEMNGVFTLHFLQAYALQSTATSSRAAAAVPLATAAERKKGKCLGAVAGSDAAVAYTFNHSGYGTGALIETVQLRYRSKLFLMVAGLRPDLVAPAAVDHRVAEEAAEAAAKAPARKRRPEAGAGTGAEAVDVEIEPPPAKSNAKVIVLD